ncbi:hypothetical protein PsYK624_145660 [Phanerochaete sordida]|uniref:Uncharacterized protein n=1 Tax=Phanerochaete sordida TaxID=48140 RepID=A0A9P3LKA4_9APHY|nr:hypothetical protein PsYK624_145660 [Phanerochaete sordida]
MANLTFDVRFYDLLSVSCVASLHRGSPILQITFKVCSLLFPAVSIRRGRVETPPTSPWSPPAVSARPTELTRTLGYQPALFARSAPVGRVPQHRARIWACQHLRPTSPSNIRAFQNLPPRTLGAPCACPARARRQAQHDRAAHTARAAPRARDPAPAPAPPRAPRPAAPPQRARGAAPGPRRALSAAPGRRSHLRDRARGRSPLRVPAPPPPLRRSRARAAARPAPPSPAARAPVCVDRPCACGFWAVRPRARPGGSGSRFVAHARSSRRRGAGATTRAGRAAPHTRAGGAALAFQVRRGVAMGDGCAVRRTPEPAHARASAAAAGFLARSAVREPMYGTVN